MSTVKMRVRLAPSVVQHFDGLTPTLKSQAVAAVLTSAVEGVDVGLLLSSVGELRRVGVNLNQLVKLAHQRGEINPAMVVRVSEFLDFLDRLRGRQ